MSFGFVSLVDRVPCLVYCMWPCLVLKCGSIMFWFNSTVNPGHDVKILRAAISVDLEGQERHQ